MEHTEKVDFNDCEKIVYTPESWDKEDNEGREGYTGRDFLNLCGGDMILAERAYHLCEWQHPETVIEELKMYSDEDEE